MVDNLESVVISGDIKIKESDNSIVIEGGEVTFNWRGGVTKETRETIEIIDPVPKSIHIDTVAVPRSSDQSTLLAGKVENLSIDTLILDNDGEEAKKALEDEWNKWW